MPFSKIHFIYILFGNPETDLGHCWIITEKLTYVSINKLHMVLSGLLLCSRFT